MQHLLFSRYPFLKIGVEENSLCLLGIGFGSCESTMRSFFELFDSKGLSPNEIYTKYICWHENKTVIQTWKQYERQSCYDILQQVEDNLSSEKGFVGVGLTSNEDDDDLFSVGEELSHCFVLLRAGGDTWRLESYCRTLADSIETRLVLWNSYRDDLIQLITALPGELRNTVWERVFFGVRVKDPRRRPGLQVELSTSRGTSGPYYDSITDTIVRNTLD